MQTIQFSTAFFMQNALSDYVGATVSFSLQQGSYLLLFTSLSFISFLNGISRKYGVSFEREGLFFEILHGTSLDIIVLSILITSTVAYQVLVKIKIAIFEKF